MNFIGYTNNEINTKCKNELINTLIFPTIILVFMFDYEGLINPCPKIICNCRTLFYYKTCSMLDVIQSQKVTHATREEVTDDPQDAVKNAREIFKCSCSRIYYTNTFFVKSTKKIKNNRVAFRPAFIAFYFRKCGLILFSEM